MINIIGKIAFYLLLVIVQYLSFTPLEFKIIANSWDKANHFLAFFTLFIVFNFAYFNLNNKIKISLLLIVGIQIELVQHFLPFREFSFLDIFADGVGISAGVFISSYLRKWYNTEFNPNHTIENKTKMWETDEKNSNKQP